VSSLLQQVTVTQKSRVKNTIDEFKVGKLFMIDLAGSERAAQTKVCSFCCRHQQSTNFNELTNAFWIAPN